MPKSFFVVFLNLNLEGFLSQLDIRFKLKSFYNRLNRVMPVDTSKMDCFLDRQMRSMFGYCELTLHNTMKNFILMKISSNFEKTSRFCRFSA